MKRVRRVSCLTVAVWRNGCNQHMTDAHVTHGELCYASLLVCHCGSVSLCWVHSGVLTVCCTPFFADGVVVLSLAAASHAQATAVRSNLSRLRTHGILSQLLSPAHTLFLGRTAERCVKHSRAGCMRAQNAGTATFSWRGAVVSRFTGTRLSSLAIGRCCRCFPTPRFLVCAVLPRHGTAAPPES